MSNFAFNKGKDLLMRGDLELDTADLRCMLVTSSYTPNADHSFVDAGGGTGPVAAELSGTGYERQKVLNRALVRDDGNDRSYLTGDDVTFPSITGNPTAAGLILYWHVTGDDTINPMIAWYDGGYPFTFAGSPMVHEWNDTLGLYLLS